MKKKSLLSLAIILATLIVFWLGASYWAGKSAQASMDKQYQWLSGQTYFTIKDRQYQRGWFSSSESATLAINPEIYRLAFERKDTPLPKLEVVFTHRIQHGPFPQLGEFNFYPAKAVVTTEFAFSAETQKFLSLFWGTQKPIEVVNRIGFSDQGKIQLSIPAFEYEEALAGIHSKWSGLKLTMDYRNDFKHIDIHANAPEFSFDARDKVSLLLNGLTFELKHKKGEVGLMMGSTVATLDHFKFQQFEGNAFAIDIEKLSYHGDLAEKDNFIDGQAAIKLAKLTLNEKAYGPAELEFEAKHLHAATLAAINTEFESLQKQELSREEFAKATLDMAQRLGKPLLIHDPYFSVRKLEVKLPDGEIKFSAGFGLKNFQESDLENPVDLVNKLSAKADFSLPRSVVESVLKWQAQQMFGGEQSNVNSAEIDELAEQFINGQIARLSEQRLIRIDGDTLSAKATLENGAFTLNDIAVPLPWQETAKAAQ